MNSSITSLRTNKEGKVLLRERRTGEIREAWPVDAFELLPFGEFVLAGEDAEESELAADPAHLTRQRELQAMNVADLTKMLKKLGHTAGNKNKQEIIARLMELEFPSTLDEEE